MRRLGYLWLAVGLVACSESDEVLHVNLPSENGQICNPLSMGHCLLPIPSATWQTGDASTPSGNRLDIPSALLPAKPNKDKQLIPVNAAPYNEADGWSPGTSIFLHFTSAVDGANLVPHENIAASVEAASPTVLLDAETGERVAHWVEFDENVATSGDDGEGTPYKNRGLLIRPAGDLKRSHRYIVAITRDLKAEGGGSLASPPAFNALRDGRKTDQPLIEKLRPRYAQIFSTLADAGVAKSDLLLAWDFDTASDEYMHRDILAMRQQAVAALGTEGIGYEITDIQHPYADDPDVTRVDGFFTSPLFLQHGGDPYGPITSCKRTAVGSCEPARLVRGDDGLPLQAGTWERPFIMIIPSSVTQETLPLVQFGHGLLGGGGEITSGYNRRFAKENRIVFIATDWTGLSSADVPVVSAALLNWDFLPTVTDRLGQGLIDGMALSYTAAKIAKDTALKAALGISADPFVAEGMTYYGISLGGIMGAGFMAIHPFIDYGVLNVPGSAWSMMIQRSSNWNVYGKAMGTGYPSHLERQVLLVLSQTLWDLSDPIAYAPHLIENPLPDTEAKKILYQEAVADSQVPNIATEKFARAANLPLITPSVRDVYGLEEVTEAPSALTIWDESPTPLPPRTNVPPEEDNHTHGSIRKLEAVNTQIMRFLYGDHLVVNTCDGVCDPE